MGSTVDQYFINRTYALFSYLKRGKDPEWIKFDASSLLPLADPSLTSPTFLNFHFSDADFQSLTTIVNQIDPNNVDHNLVSQALAIFKKYSEQLQQCIFP